MNALPQPLPPNWNPVTLAKLDDKMATARRNTEVVNVFWEQMGSRPCNHVLSDPDPPPVLVNKAAENMSIAWNPAVIQEVFKDKKCSVESCLPKKGTKPRNITIGKWFQEGFGDISGRDNPEKLKV